MTDELAAVTTNALDQAIQFLVGEIVDGTAKYRQYNIVVMRFYLPWALTEYAGVLNNRVDARVDGEGIGL